MANCSQLPGLPVRIRRQLLKLIDRDERELGQLRILFRQPDYAQPICKPGHVFRLSERLQILQTGYPQRGIELTCPLQGLLSFRQSPD